MMKILLYKGKSNYGALRVFADEIANNLTEMGHEVKIIDFMEPEVKEMLKDLCQRKEMPDAFYPDIVFSMNAIGADIRTSDGRLLHNELGVPFVSYIVDHPLYHHGRLKTRLRHHHVICVNEGFAEYVKTYYKVESVAVLMQAGILPESAAEKISKRPYSVAFIGTYRGVEEIEAQIEASDITVKNVSYCMLEELINDPSLRLEQGLLAALEKQNVHLKPEVFADTMNAMHLADKYIRALYRKMAVKSLVQSGVKVDVWGDNWQNLKPELTHPQLLCVHPPVSYREAAKIYGQSKIVLNVMPWAKEGLHDRILTTMLCGAVSLTDETTTLRTEWSDKEYALIYSLKSLEKLPIITKELLNDEMRMEAIAENGRKKAEGHTWRERTKKLEGYLLKFCLQT